MKFNLRSSTPKDLPKFYKLIKLKKYCDECFNFHEKTMEIIYCINFLYLSQYKTMIWFSFIKFEIKFHEELHFINLNKNFFKMKPRLIEVNKINRVLYFALM